MQYIQIRPGRSWHVIRTWTRVPGVAATLCNRRIAGEPADTFGDDKTCELCWRAKARAEAPA